MAWQKLRDLRLASRYVPAVRDVTIDSPSAHGVGASRTVHLDRGMTMNETVVEWQEGSGFLLRLHRGDKPIAPIFRANTFRYAIAPSSDGNTQATLTMSYDPRGPISNLVCRLVVERAFARQLASIARNMKALYESS